MTAIAVALCAAVAWADVSKAIREKARAGDAEAQLELARHHVEEARNARSERRAQRDWKHAIEWYSKSAEQGFANAQFELGGMYILGDGVEKDEDRGVALLVQAAEQGLAKAQFEIGNLYMAGAKLDQDSALGLEMLKNAANQHHVPAQKQLGTMYFQGGGVDKDLVQAHLWFSIVALSDEKAAQTYLLMLESIMDEAQIDEARALVTQWQNDHMTK